MSSRKRKIQHKRKHDNDNIDVCNDNESYRQTDLYDLKKGKYEGSHVGENPDPECGEANFDCCKKHPGHRQFIPFHKLTLKHLPDGYQDHDLYEFIKSAGDLTVRLGVTESSRYRPKFWPKTNRPYPFYNSEKSNLRTGSGQIWGVDKFQNGDISSYHQNCWCIQCQNSDSPSHVWWEFNVYTATHVVFDDIEASHTSLRLFFDKNNCPVVTVDKVIVDLADIKGDLCVLTCVTCDNNLGNKVEKKWKNYEIKLMKVNKKFKMSRDKHRLNFIVSHPHGCCKHVSVGHWINRQKIGYKTRFTYTTCTCPGSSGAVVHFVGFDKWWMSDLVHSGTFKNKLNYSGTGYVT
uniref:Uncharacterized protein n=1 Tax=Biomphalaria glabrata TaxID=6526 RepID=A0A2C9LB60_BIOGL